MSKLFSLIGIVTIALSFACKEKELEVNPCMNGKLDAGETAVDCGGTCGACPDPEPPFMKAIINGVTTQIVDRDLVYQNGYWLLSGTIDTISFQLNLGNNGNVGTYAITATNSGGVKGSLPYTFVSGTCAISAHNLTTHKMSGFFQANLARNTDTLKIRDGQFDFLSY